MLVSRQLSFLGGVMIIAALLLLAGATGATVSDGTVEFEQRITEGQGGFGGTLDVSDIFGHSVANLGGAALPSPWSVTMFQA